MEKWLIDNHINLSETEYFTKVFDLIKSFKDKKLCILPYEKLIDIENAGQSFINNLTEGLLFKIYIPNQKMWSNEFDKFIMLFREYASKISGKELNIQQHRTEFGIVCSLFSQNNDIDESEINSLYSEFTNFMNICSLNPEEAKEIISNSKIPKENQDRIFQKYCKEAQRLQIDIKHERESRLLQIKQQLEVELYETSLIHELPNYINSLIPKSLYLGSDIYTTSKINNQTININPQIIGKVEGIVSRVIEGNINFSIEERELNKVIELYSDKTSEKETLKAAVYELKDNAISKEEKRIAWQKLYGFICKVADKIGDVGVNLLTKYLEQKMGN